jgi:2-polyprenyl-3-methyl-5-hydroxy-6-metoxy-1,4-benzoquinol methylase
MNFPLSLPDFSNRNRLSELMDDHTLDNKHLYVTLKHFSLINLLFSGTSSLFRRFIFQDIKRRGLKRVTIMDIGAGGGDFARYCVSFFKKQSIDATVFCLDNDPRIISYLKISCNNYPSIQIINGSALELDRIQGDIDYCITNNVLHHFDDRIAPSIIVKMYKRARYGILVNDLARTAYSYIGFKIFAGLFFRAGFTIKDGLLSIRKGFTIEEFQNFVLGDGIINNFQIGRSSIGNIFIAAIK